MYKYIYLFLEKILSRDYSPTFIVVQYNPIFHHSPPLCSMFNEIAQYLGFFMFFRDAISVTLAVQ